MLAAGLVDEGQDDGRDQPAGRVGRHEDQEVAVSGKYGVQPGDTDAADADQDDDSRRQGIAIAAQGSGDDVDDAIEVERPGDVKETLRPQGDDVGSPLNRRMSSGEKKRTGTVTTRRNAASTPKATLVMRKQRRRLRAP